MSVISGLRRFRSEFMFDTVLDRLKDTRFCGAEKKPQTRFSLTATPVNNGGLRADRRHRVARGNVFDCISANRVQVGRLPTGLATLGQG